MSTHKYLHDNRNDQILIYVNGEILHREKAKISVFDSGFLLGDGVWEGIRFHNRHLVFIQEHLDRLFQGASSLDIDIGISKDKIKSLIISVLDANRMVTDIHIRLIVSRGLKKTPYQHPNANLGGSTIVIIPEYKKSDKTINKKGISLATVSTRRGTADTQDPQLNTLSKLNCIFACIEADKKGADEGLMMDVNGNVSTCNSRPNRALYFEMVSYQSSTARPRPDPEEQRPRGRHGPRAGPREHTQGRLRQLEGFTGQKQVQSRISEEDALFI